MDASTSSFNAGTAGAQLLLGLTQQEWVPVIILLLLGTLIYFFVYCGLFTSIEISTVEPKYGKMVLGVQDRHWGVQELRGVVHSRHEPFPEFDYKGHQVHGNLLRRSRCMYKKY